jgi:hypothetical protein
MVQVEKDDGEYQVSATTVVIEDLAHVLLEIGLVVEPGKTVSDGRAGDVTQIFRFDDAWITQLARDPVEMVEERRTKPPLAVILAEKSRAVLYRLAPVMPGEPGIEILPHQEAQGLLVDLVAVFPRQFRHTVNQGGVVPAPDLQKLGDFPDYNGIFAIDRILH